MGRTLKDYSFEGALLVELVVVLIVIEMLEVTIQFACPVLAFNGRQSTYIVLKLPLMPGLARQ